LKTAQITAAWKFEINPKPLVAQMTIIK